MKQISFLQCQYYTIKIEIWMTINYFVPDTHPNLNENKSFG